MKTLAFALLIAMAACTSTKVRMQPQSLAILLSLRRVESRSNWMQADGVLDLLVGNRTKTGGNVWLFPGK
jgi:hypothetical protein